MTLFYDAMQATFSAAQAYTNVQEIHSRERQISYDKFAESAAWCMEKMRENGLSEVELLPLLADGVTVYGDRKVSPAWCARHAVLRFPKGEILCDYDTIPCSLSMYSAATPAGGIDAEVIVVEDLQHPPAEEALCGKLILISRPSSAAVPLALRSGAVGILHDFFPLFPGVRDSREEMRGGHRWDCLSPRGTGLFAFSLTPEQGDRLRAMAKTETIRLHADVDAGDTDGFLAVLSGAIIGTDPALPEIILYGHLDEPGANDNASGCGGLLELGRAMTEAIETGRLPRPKNTIRFVLGPEYEGSMGYIHHHPNRPRLALLAADMIGNEGRDRAHITITLDPLSNYSYVDAAICLASRRYDAYTGTTHVFDTEPYWGGSDNYVADPSLKTPAVGYMNYPAQSYHSSLDTMERIEPDILRRNACIIGDFAYMLATADGETCAALAAELKAQWETRLQAAATDRQKRLYEEAYTRALHSLKRLVSDYEPTLPSIVLREDMPDYARTLGADRIPIRMVQGPLAFAAYPEIQTTGIQRMPYAAPLFWADGTRSLWDITVHTAAESGHDSDPDIRSLLETHRKLFDILHQFGYIAFADSTKETAET